MQAPPGPSAVADLRDVPLAEMAALGRDVLDRVTGRALPGAEADPVPVAAFQSSL